MLLDDLCGVVVRLRHRRARDVRLGMRVADERTEGLLELSLDRRIEPAAGRPIDVANGLFAIRRFERLIDADDLAAEAIEMRL
jgi:hypothetical protein